MNHTADCWRRHAACLAFALVGSGGVLGGSIEDARALVERSR